MKRALYVVRRVRCDLTASYSEVHRAAAYVPPVKWGKPGGKVVRRMFFHLHHTIGGV